MCFNNQVNRIKYVIGCGTGLGHKFIKVKRVQNCGYSEEQNENNIKVWCENKNNSEALQEKKGLLVVFYHRR